MGKAKRVGLYLRVSTSGQTTENQRLDLERVAQQRGWVIAKVYEDHGISGTKGRDKRPAFDQLCKDCARGELDMVMAWSIDRIGRSLQHLVNFITELEAQRVGLYLHQQAIDTNTSVGKAMIGMCSVFAAFERSLIVERVNAGLARAKAQGKVLGRKPVGKDIERSILKLRKQGLGILKIASELGIGTSVVQRVVKAAA